LKRRNCLSHNLCTYGGNDAFGAFAIETHNS
jgi:hypothetical protein